MEDKMYQHSKFLLDRLDAQYDKVNTKISLYIAINAAFLTILGLIIKDGQVLIGTEFPDHLPQFLQCIFDKSFWIFFIAIGFSALSIILLTIATLPYLPRQSTKKGEQGNCEIAKLAVHFIAKNDKEVKEDIKAPKADDSSNNKQKFLSLMYFKDIASQSEDFINKYCEAFGIDYIESRTKFADNLPNIVVADIVAQIFLLSKGLIRRNRMIRFVGLIMMLVILLVALLLMFATTNMCR